MIGVLAIQGAVREHCDALRQAGSDSVCEVRTADDLRGIEAIVLPGGESTTIRKGLVAAGIYDQLKDRISGGMPVLATCAGLVVVGSASEDGAPPCFGLVDVEVSRNGFGRQPFSFEAPVMLSDGTSIPGVFIRAPRLDRIGPAVEVIGRLSTGTDTGDGSSVEAVAVRQGTIVGCSFHPELTDDLTIHRWFCSIVKEHGNGRTQ